MPTRMLVLVTACVDLEDADDVAAMMMLLMLMLTTRNSITMTMPADTIRTPSITFKYEVWIDCASSSTSNRHCVRPIIQRRRVESR